MECDAIMNRLRDAPLPPDLATLDGAALAAIGHARANDMQRPALLAAGIALITGIVGSVMPPATAAAQPTAPFGVSSPLAPSTLLGG